MAFLRVSTPSHLHFSTVISETFAVTYDCTRRYTGPLYLMVSEIEREEENGRCDYTRLYTQHRPLAYKRRENRGYIQLLKLEAPSPSVKHPGNRSCCNSTPSRRFLLIPFFCFLYFSPSWRCPVFFPVRSPFLRLSSSLSHFILISLTTLFE